MFKQHEIQQRITDQIIAALSSPETKLPPWRRPWNSKSSTGTPTNIVSRRAYRGVNPLLLWLHQDRYGFESKFYATFDQWRRMGARVKPRPSDVKSGEWGATIIYYNIVTKSYEDPSTGIEKERNFPILRTFTVFNIDQVEGSHLDNYRADKEIIVENEFVDYAPAEAFIAGLDAQISHGGDRAFYRPSTDEIRVPHKESFHSVEDYYSTLFHELSHWTENRCAWNGSYAEGELRAEIAGCFLMSELGVPQSNDLTNHFAYLENWLSALKNDSNFIFRASTAASKAVDFLIGRKPSQESEEELTTATA